MLVERWRIHQGIETNGPASRAGGGTVFAFSMLPRSSRLLGLLADISQDAAVHIEHVTVDGVGSVRSEEHMIYP